MRIKIDIPESFDFECNIELRVSDMNYGNHLGNEKILVLAHETRVQFLASIKCTEFDIFGASIIQADAAIVYKSEGHIGDIILCKIKINNILRSSFDMYYVFENTTSNKILAYCKTGMVCYDYQNAKTISVPEQFKKLFN